MPKFFYRKHLSQLLKADIRYLCKTAAQFAQNCFVEFCNSPEQICKTTSTEIGAVAKEDNGGIPSPWDNSTDDSTFSIFSWMAKYVDDVFNVEI